MRYRVIPWKQGSRSAKALADALGGKVLKLTGSTFVRRPSDVLINYGNSNPPYTEGVLNGYPTALSRATNKLAFFEGVSQTSAYNHLPKHWTSRGDIPADAYPVVCRTILSGHSGAGIVIASDPESVVDASLYVQYRKKSQEYRVHVFKEKVFVGADDHGDNTGFEFRYHTVLVQKKIKKPDAEVLDWRVRNLHNGFIYQKNNVQAPDKVLTAAKEVFAMTGLDFGAVDVIFNGHEDKAYVLEVNTAPGLEGTTPGIYAEFIKGMGDG